MQKRRTVVGSTDYIRKTTAKSELWLVEDWCKYREGAS